MTLLISPTITSADSKLKNKEGEEELLSGRRLVSYMFDVRLVMDEDDDPGKVMWAMCCYCQQEGSSDDTHAKDYGRRKSVAAEAYDPTQVRSKLLLICRLLMKILASLGSSRELVSVGSSLG